MLFHLHFHCNFSLKWTHMLYTTFWKAQKVHQIPSNKEKKGRKEKNKILLPQKNLKLSLATIQSNDQAKRSLSSGLARNNQHKRIYFKANNKVWKKKKNSIMVCYMLTAQPYFIIRKAGFWNWKCVSYVSDVSYPRLTRRFILLLSFRINGLQCFTTAH